MSETTPKENVHESPSRGGLPVYAGVPEASNSAGLGPLGGPLTVPLCARSSRQSLCLSSFVEFIRVPYNLMSRAIGMAIEFRVFCRRICERWPVLPRNSSCCPSVIGVRNNRKKADRPLWIGRGQSVSGALALIPLSSSPSSSSTSRSSSISFSTRSMKSEATSSGTPSSIRRSSSSTSLAYVFLSIFLHDTCSRRVDAVRLQGEIGLVGD